MWSSVTAQREDATCAHRAQGTQGKAVLIRRDSRKSVCSGRFPQGSLLELGLEGVGISWMGEGQDTEGEGQTSEGIACTKATYHMWGNAQVSRAT